MTIPEIRQRMCELVVEMDEETVRHKEVMEAYAVELLQLAEATKRAPQAKPRAPSRSTKMTAQMAQDMRNDVGNYPHLSEQDLARKYNVNVGRVSEALHGKW